MRKILMTSLLLFTTNLIRGLNPYRKATMDLTKIKMSIWYLQSIKAIRLLFIGICLAGICLVLFMAGLLLLHLTIMLYAPWSASIKMVITLLFSLLYISLAAGVYFYAFAEERWLKVFNASGLIKDLSDLSSREEELSPSNN